MSAPQSSNRWSVAAVSLALLLPPVHPHIGGAAALRSPEPFVALTFDAFNKQDVWAANGGGIWEACRLALSFVSPARGFALGSNDIMYRTRTGGRTWDIVDRHTPATHADGFEFVSSNVGWLVTGLRLEKTTDGGIHWHTDGLPVGKGMTAIRSLGPPVFFDTTNGLVAATLANNSGVLYITHDGGRRWASLPLPGPPAAQFSTWFTMPALMAVSRTTWALTSGRGLFVTVDAGRRWAKVMSPRTYGKDDPIWGFVMDNASSGWLAAAATPCGPSAVDLCAAPVLLHTSTAGRDWALFHTGPLGLPIGSSAGKSFSPPVG